MIGNKVDSSDQKIAFIPYFSNILESYAGYARFSDSLRPSASVRLKNSLRPN